MRVLVELYTLGIAIFFLLFLVFVPNIALIDAVLGALLWPWGVYEHFVA